MISNYFAEETAVMLLWAKAMHDTIEDEGTAVADDLQRRVQPIVLELRAKRGTPDARDQLARIVAVIREFKGDRYYRRVIGSADHIIEALPPIAKAGR